MEIYRHCQNGKQYRTWFGSSLFAQTCLSENRIIWAMSWENLFMLQATPAMLTSRISILPLMSRWLFFHSQLFFSIFLCISTLSMSKTVNIHPWSNGYLEVIFHTLDIFCIIFATFYVEVKVGVAWRHSLLKISEMSNSVRGYLNWSMSFPNTCTCKL